MEHGKRVRTSGVLTRRRGVRAGRLREFLFFFRHQTQQHLPLWLVRLRRQQSLVMFDVETGYNAVQRARAPKRYYAHNISFCEQIKRRTALPETREFNV